jgi:hypothetical protein
VKLFEFHFLRPRIKCRNIVHNMERLKLKSLRWMQQIAYLSWRRVESRIAESIFLVADSRRTSKMQNTQRMMPQKSQQVAALACDLNPRETKTKRRNLLCRQCPTSNWYLHCQFILSLYSRRKTNFVAPNSNTNIFEYQSSHHYTARA